MTARECFKINIFSIQSFHRKRYYIDTVSTGQRVVFKHKRRYHMLTTTLHRQVTPDVKSRKKVDLPQYTPIPSSVSFYRLIR